MAACQMKIAFKMMTQIIVYLKNVSSRDEDSNNTNDWLWNEDMDFQNSNNWPSIDLSSTGQWDEKD